MVTFDPFCRHALSKYWHHCTGQVGNLKRNKDILKQLIRRQEKRAIEGSASVRRGLTNTEQRG